MPERDEKPRNDPPADSTPWYRDRRKVLGIGLVALVAAGAIALVAWNELKRPADVSNPAARFDHGTGNEVKPKPRQTVDWPTFRYDRQRTGYLAAGNIHPPYRRVWRYGGKPLLEFPPIVVRGVLYFVDNDGTAHALSARDGHPLWQRRIARLNAATPAYSAGRLYLVNMEPGQVLALNAKNGHRIWRKPLPCRSESSPLVVHKTVYFGCEDGSLYALRTRDGKQRWVTPLTGAVKASPAYLHGTIFVGDYGGAMTALSARNGSIRWQTSALGPGLGRAGSFYSTPAVAWGRVYAGNNDNRVYSFDARTGELAWTHSTGGWVYSGPSAAKVPGTRPTVYIGSFDGNVYALDARTGEARWTYPMGGRVIGSLAVIGRIVYAATFDGTNIYGMKAGTGKRVFSYHTGAYMPAVSDGQKFYLVGYSSIHALKPITYRQFQAARRKARQAKARARAKHRANQKKQ